MPVASSLPDCLLWVPLDSPYVVEEDRWDHDNHACNAEVGENIAMRLETEVSTHITTKDAPEQSSQWSHQRLHAICVREWGGED